jgi:preprotein translocase subunit SecG
MITVILVIHLLIAIAMVALILLQRSEGGALGIGGGGGGAGGGLMTGRAAGNLLTRGTGFLAAGFFATSLTLAILADGGQRTGSVLDAAPADEAAGTLVPGTDGAPSTVPATGEAPADAEPAAPMAPLSQ